MSALLEKFYDIRIYIPFSCKMLYSSEYHEDKPGTVNKRQKYESDKDKQRYKSDDRINNKTKIKIYNIITYSTSFRRYFFVEEKIYRYTYDTEKSS